MHFYSYTRYVLIARDGLETCQTGEAEWVMSDDWLLPRSSRWVRSRNILTDFSLSTFLDQLQSIHSMASLRFTFVLLSTLVYAAFGSCTFNYTDSPDSDGEALYIRNYFYVGGEYVLDESGGHVFQDQMYVERLTPLGGPRYQTPLVLIPGAGQTGTVWPSDYMYLS